MGTPLSMFLACRPAALEPKILCNARESPARPPLIVQIGQVVDQPHRGPPDQQGQDDQPGTARHPAAARKEIDKGDLADLSEGAQGGEEQERRF